MVGLGKNDVYVCMFGDETQLVWLWIQLYVTTNSKTAKQLV